MDLGPPEDSQDVQVISGESNYWQKFEEEVRFNSGRTHTWENTPRYPMETINEELMEAEAIKQHADPEY